MLYTMPNFQNPTGITTSQKHRARLLCICEKNKIILLEDGFEEEMKYFDKAILPIKSMDEHQIVFYLGTFSKILFPGLRLGWIIAPKECIQQLNKLKRIQELSGNLLSQAATFEFCNSGFYETHKKRIHKTYKRRMQNALSALKTYMPSNVSFTKPLGGYTLWVEVFNTNLSEKEIIAKIKNAGVLVSPGSQFYKNKKQFRISIAHTNEDQILKGIQIIASVLNNLPS